MKNNFIQRAITGIIFVGVLIGCILGGPISFTLLFALITALTIHEFGVIISKQPDVEINKPICMLAGVFLFLWFCLFRSHAWTNRNTDSLLISYHIPACQRAIFKEKKSTEQLGLCMMSQIYIALSFAMLNVLAYHSIGNEGELSNYQVQYNPILPLSIFIFTWINDTGAYCTGMLFGKHRLFERISPKKSWEGSIGGGVFSIIAAIVMAHYFPFMPISIWIGLALTVVIFGTLGDLTESLLKRTIGIKDSGNILPGHGGMLDRFDSTLMAVPAAVVYLYIISFIE